MKKVFLDTGGLVALFKVDDPMHSAAVQLFDELTSGDYDLYTSDYVLQELVTVLRCREKCDVMRIFRFLHVINTSDICVHEISHHMFGSALIFMKKYDDHVFSMVDCTSFIAMNELMIEEVLTTDRDFERAGFRNLLKI